MQYLSSLLTLFNSLVPSISSNNYPKVQSIAVPVNMHTFDWYYSSHYPYSYLDHYKFTDKVLVFNKSDKRPVNLATTLFSDLQYENKRIWQKPHDYSRGHAVQDFVDWSSNDSGETLKDILKLDLSKSDQLFTPIKKDIYLEYTYAQTSRIPWYAFNFVGDKSKNLYSVNQFGKHKRNPKTLSQSYITGNKWTTCDDAISKYHPNQISHYLDEDGFDGICDYIDIGRSNHNFKDKPKNTPLWTTPFAAYKKGIKYRYYWEYFYYSLGDMVDSKSRSANLLSDSADIWFIDYDKVLSLVSSGNRLKLVLNEESSLIKEFLKDGKIIESNQKLLNFLNISSELKFEVFVDYFQETKTKTFTFRDILEGKALFEDIHEEQFLLSNVYMLVSPKNLENMQFVNSENHKYKYLINVDSLLKNNVLFEDIDLKIDNLEGTLPSELLSLEHLSKHLYISPSKDSERKIRLNSKFLEHLDILGFANDDMGTFSMSYISNSKRKDLNFYGMETIRSIISEPIESDNVKDIPKKLKEKFTHISPHIWDMFIFLEKPEKSSFKEKIEIIVLDKDSYANSKLTRSKIKDLRDWDIKVPNSKNISPLVKSGVSTYSELSDLFELRNHAIELGLKKSDYVFEMVGSTDRHLEISASLNHSSPAVIRLKQDNKIDLNSSIYKSYLIDLSLVKSLTDASTSEQTSDLFNWLFSAENSIFLGSGATLSGATIATVLKKTGAFKSTII